MSFHPHKFIVTMADEDYEPIPGDFNHRGVNRRYMFMRGSVPDALVVILHPYGGAAATSYSYEGKTILARTGFSVLMPEGVRNSWNAGHCCGEALERKVDDVDFLFKLVDFLLQEHFDGRMVQVYLSGYSNGAFMASKLALLSLAPQQTRWISAIALRSGYSYELDLYSTAAAAAAAQVDKISVLAIHGGSDKMVNINGCCKEMDCCCGILTEECFPFVRFVDSWRQINRCGRQPPAVFDFSFFNMSNRQPQQHKCEALHQCGVYSCVFPDQPHALEIKENTAALFAEFFRHEYTESRQGRGYVGGTSRNSVAKLLSGGLDVGVVQNDTEQLAWFALGVAIAILLIGAWLRIVRKGRLFALAAAARRWGGEHKYTTVAQRDEDDEDEETEKIGGGGGIQL